MLQENGRKRGQANDEQSRILAQSKGRDLGHQICRHFKLPAVGSVGEWGSRIPVAGKLQRSHTVTQVGLPPVKLRPSSTFLEPLFLPAHNLSVLGRGVRQWVRLPGIRGGIKFTDFPR